MPQALKLIPETVMQIAIKTDRSRADVLAVYEYYQEVGIDIYTVFDYRMPGCPEDWIDMSETEFRRRFKFVYGENLKKFEPVVTI